MRTLVPVVTAVVTACARPAPTPPAAPRTTPVTAPTDVPVPQEIPSPDGGPGDATATSPDVPAAAPEDPRIALLRALGSGAARVSEHVDAAQGLLVVEYVEAGPGPGARAVRRSRRLCGAAVARDAAVSGMFRAAMEQAQHFELGCGDEGCTVQGMEYAPVWRVSFAGPRITAVMRLSEAALGDEYLAARDAYVRRQVEAQRSRPCPGGAR